MAQQTQYVGGSFAPRITSSDITRYRELAETADEQTKDYMLMLCRMVEVFIKTPDSSEAVQPNRLGVPYRYLEKPEIERIWDVTPWPEDCHAMAEAFGKLPSKSEIRRAAHHLLWYAVDLSRDRQPVTKDQLPSHLQ